MIPWGLPIGISRVGVKPEPALFDAPGYGAVEGVTWKNDERDGKVIQIRWRRFGLWETAWVSLDLLRPTNGAGDVLLAEARRGR